MEVAKQLLETIAADLMVLRAAYEKAGLIGKSEVESPAWRLLGGREDVAHFRRAFLLVDALVRHRVSRLILASGPCRHIAVFGGNNVGKSTVVNILARDRVASASPEGGHTRHAHVLAAEPRALFGDNAWLFRGFAPIEGAMPPDDFHVYGLSRLASTALPGDIALWDTPDCDAVGSARYVDAVIETVTVADLVVYVTSVEKYAVEHLVNWLFYLVDAGIPIVECLNKTAKRDRAVVIERQATVVFPQMAKTLGLPAPSPTVVALKNLVESDDESDLWGPQHPEADQLREAVLGALAATSRAAAGHAALDCVLRRLEPVLEPARMEILSHHDWAVALDHALAGFQASYERSYLTSSTTIEPISRLSVEILALLDPDIPGLKQTMQVIRWVTRWPSRLILGVGRQVFKAVLQRGSDAKDAGVAPELKAYSDAHVELLNALGRRIREERDAARHHPFWDSLDAEWQAQLERLTQAFGQHLEAHLMQTDADIKAAAQDILVQLEARPTTLNLLRAARVSANVGGALVGILLPHGGIVLDLVEEAIVAPAMMSATEAGATAGVDAYVRERKKQVIEKLKAAAHRIAETLYREPLLAIAERAMARAGALGVAQEVLDRLPRNLRELQTLLPTELPR